MSVICISGCSMMYVILCTRLGICYTIGIFSWYQSNAVLYHWGTVKFILKYLQRIRNYMLVYYGGDLILTGYTNYDFQIDKDSYKSIFRSIFTLDREIVWRSIEHGYVANSVMEVKYIATYEVKKESIWLHKFLAYLKVLPNMYQPLTIYCDNNRAMETSREPRSHKRGKYI